MTNNQVTVYKPKDIENIDKLTDKELNEALGFTQKRTNFPTLKTNKHAEDANEKPLPVGTFYIDGLEKKVYSKNITMRVLFRGFQYTRYDEAQKKTIDSTVILNTYYGEFVSTSGKQACGRLTKKQIEDLGTAVTAEQAIIQKQTKMKNLVFALVSYTGKTQDGEEVEVKDELVVYKPGFGGSKAIDEAIKGIVAEGRALLRTNLQLKTKRDQTGDNVYYVPVVTISKEVVESSVEDVQKLRSVLQFVAGINSYVYKAADKKSLGDGAIIDAEFVAVGDGNTPDDDVPFDNKG